MVSPSFPREKHRSDGITQTDDSYYFVQSIPYNRPQSAIIVRTKDLLGRGMGPEVGWESSGPYWVADNTARSRFVNQLGDKSSFGATLLAERKQTLGMVTTAGINLWRFYRGFRKKFITMDDAQAALWWHKSRKSRKDWRRNVPKTLGSYWLQYSYGWKPLVQDIYNGIDILQRPLPPWRVRASGRVSDDTSKILGVWGQDLLERQFQGSTVLRARVDIQNPNLWLANQLGLVNPAGVIWEAIPFSFVIDWLSNASAFLMQATDFSGLNLIDPITTRVITLKTQHSQWYGAYFARNSETRYFVRSAGIPPVKLTFAYERFQWQRGANAISLLVQALKTDGPKLAIPKR